RLRRRLPDAESVVLRTERTRARRGPHGAGESVPLDDQARRRDPGDGTAALSRETAERGDSAFVCDLSDWHLGARPTPRRPAARSDRARTTKPRSLLALPGGG